MTAPTEQQILAASENTRQPWQAPAIVFERSLEATAQGGPPQPPFQQVQGFLGPLGTSGNTGQCKT